ncbi:MAG: ribosomal protein S18-alanine N-acetyltransferase [Candidatus Lernaella stagnicola]|nr:ribosomal protein S18-alanine N-acetyltransferase [Candidatus Lernaella stagnicola]
MTSIALQPPEISIDCAMPDDLEAIAHIDAEAFLTPWHIDSFHDALSRSYALFFAVRNGGELIGYSLAWLVADELHILKFAIDKSFRSCGLGRELLEATLRRAKAKDASIAWLEVRPSNREALAMYTRAGFKVAYRRRRYYSDTGEDAIILVFSLSEDAEET